MWPLGVLLALDALLHGIVLAKYGVKDNNQPFLLSGIIFTVLAVLIFIGIDEAAWGSLIWTSIGLIGITVTWNKPQRDKTLDKIIWGLNVVIIAASVYYLFFA